MKRIWSALAPRPDTGDAPDAIAIAVIALFVGVILFFAGTLGELVALWHLGAL